MDLVGQIAEQPVSVDLQLHLSQLRQHLNCESLDQIGRVDLH
jgi:hypothetical protein